MRLSENPADLGFRQRPAAMPWQTAHGLVSQVLERNMQQVADVSINYLSFVSAPSYFPGPLPAKYLQRK